MIWRWPFRTLALVAALVAPAAAQEAAEQPDEPPPSTLVEMGTGAITGVYFPVGVALCRLANQHRPETGLRCSARPTEGSVANVAGLRDGELQLAIVQSDVQAAALAGEGAFADEGAMPDLRSVMALYPELLALVVRADADVSGIEDLAGKRVWIGPPGSGTRALADRLVAALGWTPGTFEDVPEIAPEQLGAALCDGRIDAFLYAVGHPALVIQEATTDCDAVLVDVAGPAVDELVAAAPYLVPGTIPGGLYQGTPQPVATFGVEATLVTRAEVPDDTVAAIVAPIFADLDMLRGLHPVLASLDAEAMATDDLPAPLHPAAARFYREQGWID